MTTIRDIQLGEQVFIYELDPASHENVYIYDIKIKFKQILQNKKETVHTLLYLLVYHNTLALSIHK